MAHNAGIPFEPFVVVVDTMRKMIASLLLGYRILSPADLLDWGQDPLLRHLLLEYRLPRMRPKAA